MTTPARYENVQCFDMQLDPGGVRDDGSQAKPFVALSLRVVDGPNIGTNLVSRHYLSPAAAPYTMNALRALGWTGTKLSKAMSEGLGTRKANAQLKFETYTDKSGKTVTKEKVSGIFPIKPAKLTTNTVEPSDIDSFDALFESAAESCEMPPLVPGAVAGELPPPVKRAASGKTNPNDLGY